MKKAEFLYLADLFPPSKEVFCPQCQGRPYVFGTPQDNLSQEILACSHCGFLFQFPCPACGESSARPSGRGEQGFIYTCEACTHRYQKPLGWLERPPHYQDKLQQYRQRLKAKKVLAHEALR